MYYYKYTAIIIIILLTLYVAFELKKYGRDKISFHMEIIDFITYVRQQISFFCTPTKQILEGYRETEIGNGGFFDADGIDRNIYLDERGKRLMKEFITNFGKSSSEDQIANCNYTIEAMELLISEYKKELPEKYKAYSTLTWVVGAMVVILLF